MALRLGVGVVVLESWSPKEKTVTKASLLDVIIQVAIAAPVILGALTTVLSPLLLWLLPILTGRIKDEKARQAIEAVSRAGLLGATAGSHAQQEALKAAGPCPTPQQIAAASMEGLRVAMETATATLDREHAVDKVTAYYGTGSDVSKALSIIVGHKMAKTTSTMGSAQAMADLKSMVNSGIIDDPCPKVSPAPVPTVPVTSPCDVKEG